MQLSIDEAQPARVALTNWARKLAPLRDEGVLIVGSGNLVHNLHTYAWGRHTRALRLGGAFRERGARAACRRATTSRSWTTRRSGRDALLAIPTPEHYLPLLYVLGARQSGDAVTFPVEGIDGGSISMLAVQMGSSTQPEKE